MERASWFYDLAKAQADGEQQLSAELTTRGGLLAALVGLIAVGITEMLRFHGRSWFVIWSSSFLIAALVSVALSSKGMNYEIPECVKDWETWAKKEEERGTPKNQVDDDLVSLLTEGYANSAALAMDSNDTKAARLNWAFRFSVASLSCLLLGVLFG